MNESSGQLPTSCPACSPDMPTVHEVLSPGDMSTVRCTECDHVHKTRIEEEQTVDQNVIVSQEGESFHTCVDAPEGEEIAVGEEFIVDTDEALMTVRITSLELDGEQRVEQALISDVDTIWTRGVDNVQVPITMNPDDGRHNDTRSISVPVPGDYEFTIGEHEELEDEKFLVKSIKLRDDAIGYDFEQLDYDGDRAKAKDIQRVYTDDESSSAWSVW